LKIILPGICKLFKNLFKDYLDDGKWKRSRLDEKLRNDIQSVPKHNKFSETIFGHLDRILREKPNISLIASEACIMFSHNKTIQWLRSKTDQEKSVLMDFARSNAKAARTKFRDRVLEIERRRKLILEEKMKKAEEAEKAKMKKLQGYTDEILAWGLWQSTEQIDFHLGIIKTTSQKIQALKAQLNFRKHVLLQKSSQKDIYNVTKLVGQKRINLTIEELTSNVRDLIVQALGTCMSTVNSGNDDTPILVGKNIKMYFEQDGTVKTSWCGHVISTVNMHTFRTFI